MEPTRVLSEMAEMCNGIWETSSTGKLLKVTALGPNYETLLALLDSKRESVVHLTPTPSSNPTDRLVEDCLVQIHSQVSGRIRSLAETLRVGTTIVRDTTDFGRTETKDGGRAGNKLIPVHSKLIVRCVHAQASGTVVDCALQDYLEKLPLWYIVETKLIAALQQSVNELAGQIQTYKRARVEVGEQSNAGSLGMFMSKTLGTRWPTLHALLAQFYTETANAVEPKTLGTLIAMTLRTGILIHVGNTDGGDRFKDRRGVQKLFDEYTTGVGLILHA
jgi:hypothetical protein